ncbi:MAG: primosomal protein N' [Clostridia bacterium]
MFAKIIVDLNNSAVDTLYTYEVPDELNIAPGFRVLAPFSSGNRMTEGFVLELTNEKPSFPVKLLVKALENYPAFDESQLLLAKWISRAYHCTMAAALRLMIPAQLRGLRIKEKRIRTVIYNDEFDFSGYGESLKKKDGTLRANKQFELIEFCKGIVECVSTSDLNEFFPGCSHLISSAIKRGALIERFITEYRRPYKARMSPEVRPVLTDEQKNALDIINSCTNSGKGGTILLRGVTGSGKTEVYMSAIEYAIKNGGGAIVLVPEIALTPQTVGRFIARFGDTVAVIHSRLSAGERFDEWRRIREGEVNVVVGARSAIFAPIHDIRLIVIDEEHETSYISETVPCYSATEVALKRCAMSRCALVLGSATPSLTSSFRAQHGKYTLVRLDKRVAQQELPSVHVVDMKKEFALGNNSMFSAELRSHIERCLLNKEQMIMFLNRRGYSSFVTCRGCGYIFKCDNCDVSMTYHKYENVLKCHYCNKVKVLPTLCPNCKMPYLKHIGLGTEQIELELINTFPGIRTIRMDSDTTSGKNAHEKLLESFGNGEADALIGTQMVAKGLDFPNVTLVGVILADAMLAIPDYRSAERTFQLLTQVAGRAGRSEKAGDVVIQTYIPEHTIINLAATQNYDAFYKYEISERVRSLFPPFSLFLRGVFNGENENETESKSVEFAKKVYDNIEGKLGTECNQTLLFVTAAPAPIKRIMGKFIFHVLIKLMRTKHIRAAVDAVYEIADQYAFSEGFLGIDVDPRF